MTGNDEPKLVIGETAENAARECAQSILALLAQPAKARATLAISGGSTPKLLFADLAKAKFDWSNVHIFWVDERCVPPDNKESNFKLANDTLLVPASIPPANIHRIYGEAPPPEAAERYRNEIKKFFQLKERELPVFDVIHRGMGPDAHTASLFPGSPLVHDRTGIATNVWVEKMQMDRITLLPGVLLAAKHTVLQVSGADKADAVHSVLREPVDILRFPCQIGSRESRATWFLDKAAAAKL